MPELAEVETIVRILRDGRQDSPSVLGCTIAGVQVLWERTVAVPEPEAFAGRIIGQRIVDLDRRGKFLHFKLERDHLLLHLRMSGDLAVISSQHPPPNLKHARLLFDLRGEGNADYRMVFFDARKFGRAWLVTDPQEVVGRLGPEPFDPELTGPVFFDRLHKIRRGIKTTLLDQEILAGLGNIYTDEALHMAGIHPLMRANNLSAAQCERLLFCIRAVLNEGIRRNGASIDWVYRGGDFQNYFRVYQQTGKPCPVCGTIIERMVVGQRGTHICPNCQRPEGIAGGSTG